MDLSRFKPGTKWILANEVMDDEFTITSIPIMYKGAWRVWGVGQLNSDPCHCPVVDLDPPQHRHPRIEDLGRRELMLSDENYNANYVHGRRFVSAHREQIRETYCAKKAIPGTLEAETG